MASVTVATMKSRAQSLCDKLSDGFVTDAEWLQYLNEGADELHGLLVRTGSAYVESEHPFTTDGTEDVALPSGFFKASGVDLEVSADWRDVEPFDWQERNALRNVASSDGRFTRYCIRAGNLKLLPVPPSGLSGILNYVPVRTLFTADADTYDGVNGWEQYAVVFAAKRAMDKGEEDSRHLELELQRVRSRIESEAGSRDAENPPRIRDVEGYAEDDYWRRVR